MSPDIKEMKHRFSAELKKCLQARYGGRIPPMSKIARDFSLHASHLPHVSVETVRKWIRGETIPQYPRAQSLSDWLGPELLMPFENWPQRNLQDLTKDKSHISHAEASRCIIMMQKLARDEFNLVIKLTEILHNKQKFKTTPLK